MALKRKLTKAEYDKLPDAVKFEYKQQGDDYVLDVEGGLDDPAELKRAKDREKQRADEEAQKATKALSELEELRKKLEDEGTLTARKKGDIEALEKSWQKKLDDATAAGAASVGKLQGSMRKLLVDNVAAALATKISSAPNLLLPHIKARLDASFDGDEPTTRVIGADGKPSALTLDDLEKEFVANSDFAAIIIGSKASGGGAGGGKQGAGGARKKLSEMSEAERVAFQKEDPQGFDKAVEAAKPANAVRI